MHFAIPLYQKDGDEGLAVLAELREGSPPKTAAIIMSSMMRAISGQYGIGCQEIWLLQKGSLPKTTSGKLRRNLTRKLFEHGVTLAPLYTKSSCVSMITKTNQSKKYTDFQNFLAKDAYVDELKRYSTNGRKKNIIDKIRFFAKLTCGIEALREDENLLEAGIDSLALVQLHSILTAATDTDVLIRHFFENPSPSGIAATILAELRFQHPVSEAANDFQNNLEPSRSLQRVDGWSSEDTLHFLRRFFVWVMLLVIIFKNLMAFLIIFGVGVLKIKHYKIE